MPSSGIQAWFVSANGFWPWAIPLAWTERLRWGWLVESGEKTLISRATKILFKPMPQSIQATPAVPCSTSMARSSGSTLLSSTLLKALDLPFRQIWPNRSFNSCWLRDAWSADGWGSAFSRSPELARKFGVREGEGVLVNEVFEKDPAASAGIKPGDIITKIDGNPVDTPNRLSRLVAGLVPGATAKV